MKVSLLIFTCICLFTFGCNNRLHEAKAFNQKVSNATSMVRNKGKDFKQTLTSCLKTRDFMKLARAHKELVACIDKNATEIKQMPNVGGSELLKNKTLEFLRFEKQLADTVTPILLMNADTPSDVVAANLQRLFMKSQDENSYILTLMDAQLSYARKNGFSME